MQTLIALLIFSLVSANAAPPVRSKKRVIIEQRAEKGSLEETQETIGSLSLLLKKTAPNPSARRNVLLLNRAAALSLAARLKMIASSKTEVTPDVKKTLGLSIHDAKEVLASRYAKSDQIAKAHDVLGVAYLYLDENRKARIHFLHVLKMSPSPDKAGWIGLVVAEDYFDEENYQEAAQYYTQYLPLMSSQGKDLALYKLGWCMLNLNQQDDAEKYFAQVAKSKGASGVGKDAIRDLAFLVTRRTDPMPSILRAEAYFSALPEKLEYLHAVRMNLESENAIELHTQIVARLMGLEKDTEKLLELALSNLRVQRKLYASSDHLNAFLKVKELLEGGTTKKEVILFKKYEEVIENELQSLMKSYLDTYANRTKTLEKLTKQDLTDALKKQFRFYNDHFEEKPGYPVIMSTWSEICLDMKDWPCLDEASEAVLEHPKQLAKYTERAYLDEISSIDLLLVDQKTKDKKKLRERRDLRIHQFVEKFPKSPQWIRIAKMCSQSEIDNGNVQAAIPILKTVFELEPTEDSFYRLQYARFQLKKYDDVVSDSHSKTYLNPDSKVAELYRESSLVLAQRAKGSKKTEEYKKNLSEFVSLSNDSAKTRIARSDYFNFMLEQNRPEDAAHEFLALPPAEARDSEWESLRVDLWKQMVDKGHFDEAFKLAQLSAATTEGLQRQVLSALFVSPVSFPLEVKSLSKSIREYFFGVFALTKPSWVIEYYSAQKREMKSNERGLIALSYKIKSNNWRIERTAEGESLLGSDYSFSESKGQTEVPIENFIEQIRFPALNKLSSSEQSKSVQYILVQVHGVRSKVVPAIQGKSGDLQLRILEKARDLEAKMSDYLLTAPVPKQLGDGQADEYKKGMATAAAEFSDQSRQFEGLAAKIRERLTKDTKWLEARTLPAPDMGLWPWPLGSQLHPQLQWVYKLLKDGNKMGALGLLDYYREKYVKRENDYFSIRSGILLTASPGVSERIYVLDELEKNDQKTLIEHWSHQVGRSNPILSEAK